MESTWQQVVDGVIEKLRAMVTGLFGDPRYCTLGSEEANGAQRRGAMSEHQLMAYCAERGAFTGLDSLSGNLALFYKHFLIMHVLYELQDHWWRRGLHLRVSPLAIDCIEVRASSGAARLGAVRDAVADYYRDLSHLQDMTDAQVNDLLSNFWAMFTADHEEARARQVLELDDGADWSNIQKAYRRKAAATHPDKGGSEGAFIEVQQAFDVLATRYTRRKS